MFSGPVTTMTSMPAAARSLRARATRWSYSAFGKADSEPCRMPSLSIAVVSDEVGGCSVESDAKARCVARVNGSCRVRDARDGIVNEAVGAVELRKSRRCRAGHVKRRGGRGGALVHLANHEWNARTGQPPRRSHGRRNATELPQFEVRKTPTAIAADPNDVIRCGHAFVEHHRQRTSVGEPIDGRPVSGWNGLLDIGEIVDSQCVEPLERFRGRPPPVGVRSNLDLRAEALA